MHRQTKWIVFALFAVAMAALAAIPQARRARTRQRLDQVRRDYESLFNILARYGIDYCGQNYPEDTSARRMLDPGVPLTFESDLQFIRTHGYCYSLLTTPIAYTNQIPHDPFRSDGQYYGYYSNFTPRGWPRTFAVLRSVGPDGAEDLPLAEMRASINALFIKNGRRYDTYNNPEVVNWLQAMVAPYQYDPTNGAASRGDLILVMNRCSQSFGYGAVKPWPEYHSSTVVDLPAPEQPSPQSAQHPAGAESLDEASQTWTQATVKIPDPLWQAWQGAGFRLIQAAGQATSATARLAPEERTDSLRNHLGEFREFFSSPAILAPEQCIGLEFWQKADPGWWAAVAVNFEPARAAATHTLPAADCYPLMALYGKSKLLLAAQRAAERQYNEALDQIATLQGILARLQWQQETPRLSSKYGRTFPEQVRLTQGDICNKLIKTIQMTSRLDY